jgi:hypothetical protein
MLERNMLFISHAGEDNDFTQWLALQLSRECYGVWCDLTKLLGGENWPKEINQALQERAQRFLFILSRYSNSKDNPLGELELALTLMKKHQLGDFVVLLKIDDIQKEELDFRIQNIQWIDFTEGWYSGLLKLLKLLGRENILKNELFGPTAVNYWWSTIGAESISIIQREEFLCSNRFEILSLPKTFYIHVCESEPALKGYIKYPIIPYKNYLISFNSYNDLNIDKGIVSPLIESLEYPISNLIDGTCPIFINNIDAENQLIKLINQAFEKYLKNIGLREFYLSKGRCYYFDKNVLEDGRIIYTNSTELSNRTKLWGKRLHESWHFALRPKYFKEPKPHYLINTHIVISGGEIHAASPSATKRWKNNHWRDRLRASMLHIAEDQEIILLVRSKGGSLTVKTKSIEFKNTVTYNEPNEPIDQDE